MILAPTSKSKLVSPDLELSVPLEDADVAVVFPPLPFALGVGLALDPTRDMLEATLDAR